MGAQTTELNFVAATIESVSQDLGRDRGMPEAAGRDDVFEYYVALVETMARFVGQCPVEIAGDSYKHLKAFFDITVGDRIKKSRMNWIVDDRRPFVLRCLKFLAETAAEIATAERSPVTPAVLQEAARRMIKEFDNPACPFPLREPSGRGSACADLGGIIDGMLDQKG